MSHVLKQIQACKRSNELMETMTEESTDKLFSVMFIALHDSFFNYIRFTPISAPTF